MTKVKSNVEIYVNEFGTVIPETVILNARKLGIKTSSYLYEEGKYGAGYPAASIGGAQSSRFRSVNYVDFKVDLGDGFVAFRSPSSVKGETRGKRL